MSAFEWSRARRLGGWFSGTLVRPWLDSYLKGNPGAQGLFGDRLSTEDVTWRQR